jgi:hypothetical protein
MAIEKDSVLQEIIDKVHHGWNKADAGSIRANSTNRWRDETSDFVQICTVGQELLCYHYPQRIFKNK